jgi:hypothetical protein
MNFYTLNSILNKNLSTFSQKKIFKYFDEVKLYIFKHL